MRQKSEKGLLIGDPPLIVQVSPYVYEATSEPEVSIVEFGVPGEVAIPDVAPPPTFGTSAVGTIFVPPSPDATARRDSVEQGAEFSASASFQFEV